MANLAVYTADLEGFISIAVEAGMSRAEAQRAANAVIMQRQWRAAETQRLKG